MAVAKMTAARARNEIARMDLEIETLMVEHSDIEAEIEEKLLRRYRFIQRHAKVFAPKELAKVRATWPEIS